MAKVWELRSSRKPSDEEALETACKERQKLFPVEVIEESSKKYKVRYTGYDSSFDKWKNKDELVAIDFEEAPEVAIPIIERHSLYNELAIRIKTSLNSNRKGSPIVRIDLPFDKIEFDGGLRRLGTPKCRIHDIEHFTISKYQDLNQILGTGWHVRGVNSNGDFSCVILDTVEFYIYKRRSITEYRLGVPPLQVHIPTGYILVFTFVKGDGSYF